MRSILYVVCALGVMALAFWAYQQNYATQAALREVESLHGQIGNERAKLAMLRAEWAYLNRPERLRELAYMNFDTLRLLPFTPDRFGEIEDVPYPVLTVPIANPVDLAGAGVTQ